MYSWNDNLRIGDTLIDSQHQKLFQICRKISEIFEDNDEAKNRRVAAETVKYLKAYTLQHFADEENLMLSVAYENYMQHCREHAEFAHTAKMQEAILETEQYSKESIQRFLDLVNNWLVDHIMDSDQTILTDRQ